MKSECETVSAKVNVAVLAKADRLFRNDDDGICDRAAPECSARRRGNSQHLGKGSAGDRRMRTVRDHDSG